VTATLLFQSLQVEYLKQVPYNPKLYYHVLSTACSKCNVAPALKVHVSTVIITECRKVSSTAVKCPPVEFHTKFHENGSTGLKLEMGSMQVQPTDRHRHTHTERLRNSMHFTFV